MRKTEYPKTRGARQYAGLILPVCAMIVLSGWSGCPRSDRGAIKRPPAPRPSPIRVSDGSMIVRTRSNSTFTGNTLTITGGTACSITDANNMTTKLGSGWTITSSDGRGTISTTDGKTIVATVNADVLQDDTTNGPGAEFGKQKVVFSPATLNDNKNNTSTTIHCQLPKACTINYAPSCS